MSFPKASSAAILFVDQDVLLPVLHVVLHEVFLEAMLDHSLTTAWADDDFMVVVLHLKGSFLVGLLQSYQKGAPPQGQSSEFMDGF